MAITRFSINTEEQLTAFLLAERQALCGYVRKYLRVEGDEEDVVQAVVIELLREIRNGRVITSKSYIYYKLDKRAIDHARRQKRLHEVPIEELTPDLEPAFSPKVSSTAGFESMLTVLEKQLLLLVYDEGLKIREASVVLRLNYETLKKIHQRLLDRLSELSVHRSAGA